MLDGGDGIGVGWGVGLYVGIALGAGSEFADATAEQVRGLFAQFYKAAPAQLAGVQCWEAVSTAPARCFGTLPPRLPVRAGAGSPAAGWDRRRAAASSAA